MGKAEQQAREIRLRAERRMGELLKEMAKKGERRHRNNGRPKASNGDDASSKRLEDLGLTRDQSSQYQQLAEMKQNGQRHGGRGNNRKLESRDTTPKLSDFGISRDQGSRWQQCGLVLTPHLAKRDDFFHTMSAEDTTTAAVQVLLRRADQRVLSEAAARRKQTLQAFLSETLAVVAVDLRQPPRVALTWLDTFRRHPEPAPDNEDDDIRWTEPRPARRTCLPTGPPAPRNRG